MAPEPVRGLATIDYRTSAMPAREPIIRLTVEIASYNPRNPASHGQGRLYIRKQCAIKRIPIGIPNVVGIDAEHMDRFGACKGIVAQMQRAVACSQP